jgi:hypothetical protein
MSASDTRKIGGTPGLRQLIALRRNMSASDSHNAGGPGTSILAREIAQELAPLISWTERAERLPDPKGLRDVEPALLNIEQAAKYLGRTVKGVRDLEKKGVLVPVRFDRKIQFRRRDLDDAIERHSA